MRIEKAPRDCEIFANYIHPRPPSSLSHRDGGCDCVSAFWVTLFYFCPVIKDKPEDYVETETGFATRKRAFATYSDTRA